METGNEREALLVWWLPSLYKRRDAISRKDDRKKIHLLLKSFGIWYRPLCRPAGSGSADQETGKLHRRHKCDRGAELSHEQVVLTYKEQGGVERGFRFLKDPLFLASSIFVKKPERVMALSFIMVLCLLVYRLAEHVLRRQLTAASQTVPNQVNKPTDRPTMRWIFQCFEGIDLLHIHLEARWQTQILGCNPSINRFFVCLVLPIVTSIFCLRKLRTWVVVEFR